MHTYTPTVFCCIPMAVCHRWSRYLPIYISFARGMLKGVLLITVWSRPEPSRHRPEPSDGVYRCGPPLMSAAHTSPTLSLTSQIELVKWDPGFTDFDEKINASFICFEPDLQAADIDTVRTIYCPIPSGHHLVPGVKTELEKKVDRLSLSCRGNTLAFSRQRVPLNNNPKPPIV